jgi:ubiquinone/menaquinone biosynthesis C-methylase UbiE
MDEKAYWKDRSEDYNKLDWVNKNKVLDVMVEMAGDYTNKRVLDIGTGTGKVLKALHKKDSNASLNGVDISRDMVDSINGSFDYSIKLMDMEDMDFTSHHFDLATARMVLHHARDSVKAVKEIRRVLKPGGKFIICEGNPPSKECIDFYKEIFKHKEDRLTFLLDDLVNLLLYNGFRNVVSKTVILGSMSLNNWLENSGVPSENVEVIRGLHLNCSDVVRRAYNMKFIDGDVLMTWKFSIVSGVKI